MGNSPAKIETISRAVSENVQQTVNSAVVNMVSSTNAALSGNQVIDINGINCAGSINLSGISQKSVIKYNLSRVNTSQNYQTVRSSIAAGIENALNSDTSIKKGALSLATDMGVTNEAEAVSRVVNQVANSYTFNQFSNDVTQINNSQTVSIKNAMNRTGDCDLSNISQSIVLDVLSKQIAESVSKSITDMLTKSKTYQSATTKTDYTQTGVLQDFFSGLSNLFSSISGFFWIILIVVFVAIFGIGYLVYQLLSDSDEPVKSENTVASE